MTGPVAAEIHADYVTARDSIRAESGGPAKWTALALLWIGYRLTARRVR